MRISCYMCVALIIQSIVPSIWHNSAADLLRFRKFPLQISESCGTTYRRNCEVFSALQSTSGPLTDGVNSVQIDA